MKLLKTTIHKYKCIEKEQTFDVQGDITVLVGMNESGKTSILEALAKTNYFQDDKKFKFNSTHDYPRKEKKSLDKSGEDPKAVTCVYEISDEIKKKIDADLGKSVFLQTTFSISTKFGNEKIYNDIKVDKPKFVEQKTDKLGISSKTLNDKIISAKDKSQFSQIINEYKDDIYKQKLEELKKYFENKWGWPIDPIGEYIARTYLTPNLPKFLYYDEYYSLPSRISLEKMENSDLDEDELKTAKALFELADIDVKDILEATDYEDFKAELEATQAIITDELFKYWETNKNLEIIFDIDKIIETGQRSVNTNHGVAQVVDANIVEHVLDIRVKNRRSGVSLPLRNRSKGFNWFFSFLVWFKKIQEDHDSNYIILLDEPGLNLHAKAQDNLLNFLEDLSANYQIVYTTHSPFMIDSNRLDRVLTIVETQYGSLISDTIQEKDPNTLFPLQAALGYDIAQNLFISKNNLLVEGPADLLYLTVLSNILEGNGRIGLKDGVTIVPVGGLDKVATFISLLRGSHLNIVCLLDTFTDSKGKQKVDDLVLSKIIKERHIRFFDEFSQNGSNQADIEDLFSKEDYLKIFNHAFLSEFGEIALPDLNPSIQPIIIQLNKKINRDRFNHYKPAMKLTQLSPDISFFSIETLDNFENSFKEINKLFD
jgi:predicted ATP-dependent endonuclease of OLD family